jgi:hypothetical protein
VSGDEVAEPASLSKGVCALLTVLSGGADDGCLNVSGRTLLGFGERHLVLSASVRSEWIPGPLLGLLEADQWALAMTVPVTERGAMRRPLRLGAVVATVECPRVYRNRADPADTRGRGWMLDLEALAAAFRRFMSFLPPAMVVDAGTSLTAVWALTRPLDVRSSDAQARALDLHRRLARATGGVEPGEAAGLQDLQVPVPGSAVREPPYTDQVAVLLLDDRHHTIEDLEAACAAALKE